ncbi:hypothetical protein M9Y10_033174 [Tritrichomonas musculus]|uniref:DUF3447 domain-containing protein n=1 Tax=Tritrichomonas musculus TaxID=1915356 RepID=A0ABR2GX91_9EUKA
MCFSIIVEKMKEIQNILLDYLDNESESKEELEHFIKILKDQNIVDDKHDFKLLLQLLIKIVNNHQRIRNFISKTEQILEYFKKDIQKYFTNSEIFDIFGNNKIILLFLIEENVFTIDEHIVSQIPNKRYARKDYIEYFGPEIRPFITKEFIKKYWYRNIFLGKDDLFERIKNEVDGDFYEKRREGENDDYLCQLIRFNKIKEFVIFVEQTNLSLESKIKNSIFETNQLLAFNDDISLIEYASFYGSNDIIKYMQMKGVELRSSMWIYAIHSRNAELIKYLEDNQVSPPYCNYETILNGYERILNESIKCHHNEISNYIIDNLIKKEDLQDKIENKYEYNLYRFAFEYSNYCFFPENMKHKNVFFYLCEFDYYTLVRLYLSEVSIDINAKVKPSIL